MNFMIKNFKTNIQISTFDKKEKQKQFVENLNEIILKLPKEKPIKENLKYKKELLGIVVDT